ncbi:hypothetical protein HME01_32540 [Vreelandella aquamarina]|uniref:hypothetical protein n=1 Tax=Vreelandella aquamarina TaxID=77097 RepID=UPI00111547BA|nr:hypothetical protein [Halomonas meridiana]GED47402.1 hypothetical protein HME01_32540 [Halomonas meridiana]
MEITLPLIKIAAISLATLGSAIILKPAALVIRDYLLWKAIKSYLKRSKFEYRAMRYAASRAAFLQLNDEGELIAEHNKKPTRYWLEDQEISKEEFARRKKEIESARSDSLQLLLKINKEKAIIGSILRHFDQSEGNPIPEIVKDFEERFYPSNA